MDCSENRKLISTRRAFLTGGATFAAWAYMPKFALARMSGQDPRLIIVILRGALDGLATVAPLGDPDYARLHGSIALQRSCRFCRFVLPLRKRGWRARPDGVEADHHQ